jgi:ATP-dependent RNA helicase RhlE
MTFKDLKLSETFCSVLEKKGYSNPTPIQEKAIPEILSGNDVFGCAQTGTGKTAAFALPILQKLGSTKKPHSPTHVNALILAPTRELALQIFDNFKEYGSGTHLKYALLFGGVSTVNQINQLKNGVDILVATPGRLLDLFNQGYVNLNFVKYLVLDEADRMLDMGFIHDIKKILSKLPGNRQNLLFSATIPDEIRNLADTILKNPITISVTPVSTASALIKQSVYHLKREHKRDLLKHLIKKDNIERALVFTRTKKGAERLVKDLNKNGILSDAIHGDKTQSSREKALKKFKNQSIQVLVATDIASRGIDVDKLSHVINFEIPEQAETYVHRIGRTGRAGENGTAISFCTVEELPYMKDINKLTKNTIEIIHQHPYI